MLYRIVVSSFDDGHFHFHIRNRAIGRATFDSGNLIDDIKALDDLTKDRIVTIEMRRTTDGGIGINLLLCQCTAHLTSHHLESVSRPHIALNNIELARRGSLGRVHLIGLTSGSQRTFFMDKARDKFGRNGITKSTVAKHLTRFGIAGIRVTTLNHELIDNAMEQEVVIETLFYQLYKIVAMFWSLIIELDGHISVGSLNQNVVFLFRGSVLFFRTLSIA